MLIRNLFIRVEFILLLTNKIEPDDIERLKGWYNWVKIPRSKYILAV